MHRLFLRTGGWLIGWLLSVAALGATPGLQFVENRGQWPAAVRYRAALPGGTVYLTDGGLVYDWLSADDLVKGHDAVRQRETTHQRLTAPSGLSKQDTPLHGHAIFVDFEGATPAPRLSTPEALPGRYNYYYGNDPAHWATDVPVVPRVTYQELYPGISLDVYGTANGQLEYDVRVAPEADVAAMRLRYRGADGLALLPDGSLRVQTSVGTVQELAPVAWQQLPAGRQPVACRFVLRGRTVSYCFPAGYDRRYPLIIDPQVTAATFSGSRGVIYGVAATPDGRGNIVSGGRALATGLPVTPGAYQTTFRGSIDHAICKYDSTAQQLLFATYLGGVDIDELNALRFGPGGALYLLGSSYSPDFPTLRPYDAAFNGNYDLVLSTLNDNGQLIGSTFLGGTGNDEGSDLAFAANGDVYVLGTTTSPDLPAAARYDPNYNDRQDVMLAQLTPDLHTLWWATYLGGSHNDVAAAMRVDARNGDVVVIGNTYSADFPVTAGALIPQYWSRGDGFVARLDAAAFQLKASTYWGAPDGEDELSGLHLNPATGQIFVLGGTAGNLPTTPGALHVPGGNAFVSSLMPDLTQQQFTAIIGATTAFTPMTLAQDACGNILGAGYAAEGMTVLNAAPTMVNARRGNYLFVLRHNGSGLLSGWYYGDHEGHSHSPTQYFDRRGQLYHAVCAGRPARSPAYAPTSLSTHDVVTFKAFLPVGERVLEPRLGAVTSGCAPLTVAFDNQTRGGRAFRWDFGDGTPADTARRPTHVYTRAGTYRVLLSVQGQEGSCLSFDTARTTVQVQLPVVRTFPPQRMQCGAGSVSLTLDASVAGGNATYRWSTGETTPSITVQDDGLYTVSIDQGGCRWQDTLRVLPTVRLRIPNVITPNGDGKNDAFAPEELPTGCRLTVFNRWGRQVFSAADYQSDWRAEGLPAGVYYYLIEGEALCEKRLKGWLEVVR